MSRRRSEPPLSTNDAGSPISEADSVRPFQHDAVDVVAQSTGPTLLGRPSLLPHYSAVVTPVSVLRPESVRPGPTRARLGSVKAPGRYVRSVSNASLALSKIGVKAVSKNGTIAAVIYVVFATMLAVSTYGLDSIANKPINLGIVEQAWFHDVFDVPITTFLRGATSTKAVETTWLVPNFTASTGTQSLSDLQYDTCGFRDAACADNSRPNTEIVLYRLAHAFSLISRFDVPELALAPDRILFSYVNTLSGYNFPVVQFHIPGVRAAVVCSVRRNRYRVAQEADGKSEIDSVALCSERAYDPDWGCENEVAKDVATHVIQVKEGKATYLGSAPRSEFYYNPGNVAKLTGSAQGTGLLATVIGIDEYNGGILQSAAPWDMAPAYLCKGTFDPVTNTGMRWQGQGAVSMTWKSSSLMVTNSFVLWSITMGLAIIQFLYLSNSSACVIPVYMSQSGVGIVILGFVCYGNYNVQVLTTYLNLNKVSTFDATPYRLCGPAMFSSVIAIMSGTAIQWCFLPRLVAPSYILTIVSVVNWIVVFVLEAFVFPKASVMISRECGLASSTTCSYYSATVRNYFRSSIVAACAISVGILVVSVFKRRAAYHELPPTNSVLALFRANTVRDMATSGSGGCVLPGRDGVMVVDPGIMLCKNLVRVSSTVVVWSWMVKYVILYRLLPTAVANYLNRSIGVTLVITAKDDRVEDNMAFLELKDMDLDDSVKFVSGYYA